MYTSNVEMKLNSFARFANSEAKVSHMKPKVDFAKISQMLHHGTWHRMSRKHFGFNAVGCVFSAGIRESR